MGSSRGTGIIEVVSECGTTFGALYTSIITWEGNSQVNLFTGVIYSGTTAGATFVVANSLDFVDDSDPVGTIATGKAVHPYTINQGHEFGNHNASFWDLSIQAGYARADLEDVVSIEDSVSGAKFAVDSFVGTCWTDVLEMGNVIVEEAVTINGATVDGDNRRIIRSREADRHKGVLSWGPRIRQHFGSHPLYINSENFFEVQDILMDLKHNVSAVRSCVNLLSSSDVYVIGCHLTSIRSASTGPAHGVYAFWSGVTCINTFAYDCTNAGYIASSYSYLRTYNCASIGNGGWGYYASTNNNKSESYNCISKNNGAGGWGGYVGTMFYGTCFNAEDVTFVSWGTNWHLDESDTDCTGLGADLSSYGTARNFSDDIDWETRS